MLTTRVAETGVPNRLLVRPKIRLGNTPSRPMAKRMRETLACEAIAQAKHPATKIAVKNADINDPPTFCITCRLAESASLNACQSGNARWLT
ncbi:hypothetical protein D3C73_1543150 [compost metagenome]